MAGRGDTCGRQQGGQVEGGHVQGKEARAKHDTVRVKAGAVEEEMFWGLLHILAPGAMWGGGDMEAMQVGCECGVSELQPSECHI